MIELLIAACLAQGECREFSLLYDPTQVTLVTCITAGHVEVARWDQQHPEWTVARWSCEVVDPSERSA